MLPHALCRLSEIVLLEKRFLIRISLKKKCGQAGGPFFFLSVSSAFFYHCQSNAFFTNYYPSQGYVEVKFLCQIVFVFLLFLGMVMYANEVETKEK